MTDENFGAGVKYDIRIIAHALEIARELAKEQGGTYTEMHIIDAMASLDSLARNLKMRRIVK